MKGTKCLGILSLFFITAFVSLNASLDANALRYPINTISVGPNVIQFRNLNGFYFSFNKAQSLYFAGTNNQQLPDGFTFPHTWNFTGNYDSEGNFCYVPTPADDGGRFYTDGVDYYRTNSRSAPIYRYKLPDKFANFGWDSTFDINDLIDPDDSPFDTSSSLYSQSSWLQSHSFLLCNIHGLDYTERGSTPAPFYSSFPTWDWSSLINIPLVNSRLEYEKSKPYTYGYDVLKINGQIKSDDGIVYSKEGLKMSEIFGTKVPTFSSLQFPLNDFNESTSWLSPDDTDDSSAERVYSFDVTGSILFDSDYTIESHGNVHLYVYNYYDPNSSVSDYYASDLGIINGHTIYEGTSHYKFSDISCDMSEKHISSGDQENRLDFVCHYDPVALNAFSPEINFRYISFLLGFSGITGSEYYPFLTTDGDYMFKDFNIITNDDDTYSGWSGSASGSGGNMSAAPGDDGYDESSPDFIESLKTLFSFNFINPFAPLFDMFNSNDNCASIPTLAGMIHSEESTVCPWFDSSVRSIVTPVLSLSSMMLVFGFAVRWLGSSSGNMFTDSAGEEVSNQGGKWGHFKKGKG